MRTAFSLTFLLLLPSLAAADDLAVTGVRAPRLAVATDPIGLFAGRYALSASYVTSRWTALRAEVQVIEDTTGWGNDGWRAALSLPLYLDRPLHGPYVEPGVALVDRVVGYAAVGGIGAIGDTMTVPTIVGM